MCRPLSALGHGDMLKFKLSIRMEMKGGFEFDVMRIFLRPPSLGFTENWPKKRNYPSSSSILKEKMSC